jgi:hypothetical protein
MATEDQTDKDGSCPVCGSSDRPHFCPEKPPMVSIDLNSLKRFWEWLKRTFNKQGAS